MTTRTRRGFTIVELLIVIAILALLAAVAVPQFSDSGNEGKTAAMVSSLSVIRTAVDSYWSQHDAFPGQTDGEQFARQLTLTTNKAGQVGAGIGYGYGPYLRRGVLPSNPFVERDDVLVVHGMPTKATGTEAWIYDASTGEVRANVDGATPDGIKLFDL